METLLALTDPERVFAWIRWRWPSECSTLQNEFCEAVSRKHSSCLPVLRGSSSERPSPSKNLMNVRYSSMCLYVPAIRGLSSRGTSLAAARGLINDIPCERELALTGGEKVFDAGYFTSSIWERFRRGLVSSREQGLTFWFSGLGYFSPSDDLSISS